MSDRSNTRRATRHTETTESNENMNTETSATALNTATQDTASVVVKIADLDVTLPLKFTAGHALTDTQAKILDAAYQRQFTNNQNAMAKARAEKLAKAIAANDAAAVLVSQPLTADAISALYTNYEPQVGGGPRLSSMEKIRLDAAWRAYVKAVKEHNADLQIVDGKAVGGGDNPVFLKARGKVVTQMSAPRKAKDVSEEAHKTALEEYQAQRSAFLNKMLSMPEYADRIQTELDSIMAERGKAEDTAADTVSVDIDAL